MRNGGFFEDRPMSPTAVTVVVALHAAALGALALTKMEMPSAQQFERTVVINVPLPSDPPPPLRQPRTPPRQTVTVVKPLVLAPTRDPVLVIDTAPKDVIFTPAPGSDPIIAEPLPPITPPARVRTQASLLPSSALQPPYPAAEQRAGAEGEVSVRVSIAGDGRVTAVERLSATSDAFYRATERHALRAWRFRPATLDGVAVPTRRVITVRFRLDG